MTFNPLLLLPAAEMARLFRRKELSPVDLARAALDVVAAQNPRLNFVAAANPRDTLAAARAAEARYLRGEPLGPVDGVPLTVKDWYDIKGWPTRMGSRLPPDTSARADGVLVEKLRAAGLVTIVKTTLPEFGHKGVTDSPLCGITRNPWDDSKTCGGSSGGAAVAAAIGVAPFNLGSDAGGSIRIPASFCGVLGIKPSPGLVPAVPPSLFSTLSSAGPLTRCVADAALMLDVIVTPDSRDWHQMKDLPRGFFAALKKPLPRRPRIGFALRINDTKPTAPVAAAMKIARQRLETIADVETISLDVPDIVEVFNRHWMAVAAHIVKDIPLAAQKKMDPRFRHWAARGKKLSLDDYLWAERRRMDIGAAFKQLFTRFDFIVTPTTAMTAFDAGQNMPAMPDGTLWDDWTPYTYGANLARLPAASIPCGLTRGGLPVGLQVMAATGDDISLLQLLAKLEPVL